MELVGEKASLSAKLRLNLDKKNLLNVNETNMQT
jgi:hypothetical protein